MELKTVRQVSLDYGISNRMLCYYEEIGLIKSSRIDDYAYRVYDIENVKRLQQIIILRKLQIPTKQIKDILENQNAVTAIEIFKKNINELDERVTALSAVKSILMRFVDDLQEKSDISLKLDLLNDKTMLAIINSLSFSENKIKEKVSMQELNKVADVLNTLHNPRVIYIPPITVASIYLTGDNVDEGLRKTKDFAKQNDIFKLKPDLRLFISEHAHGHMHGSEVLLSIPDDFDVPAPFIKKKFKGGQYVAHVLGENVGFGTYKGLRAWIDESSEFQYDFKVRCEPSTGELSLDLEEVLNYYHEQTPSINQIDVLLPIKPIE